MITQSQFDVITALGSPQWQLAGPFSTAPPEVGPSEAGPNRLPTFQDEVWESASVPSYKQPEEGSSSELNRESNDDNDSNVEMEAGYSAASGEECVYDGKNELEGQNG